MRMACMARMATKTTMHSNPSFAFLPPNATAPVELKFYYILASHKPAYAHALEGEPVVRLVLPLGAFFAPRRCPAARCGRVMPQPHVQGFKLGILPGSSGSGSFESPLTGLV